MQCPLVHIIFELLIVFKVGKVFTWRTWRDLEIGALSRRQHIFAKNLGIHAVAQQGIFNGVANFFDTLSLITDRLRAVSGLMIPSSLDPPILL